MHAPGAHTNLGFWRNNITNVCILVGTQLMLNKHLLTISYNVHAIYL